MDTTTSSAPVNTAEKKERKAISVYRVLCAEADEQLIEQLWARADVESRDINNLLDALQTSGDIVVNQPSESDWQTLTLKVKTPDSEIDCELEVGANFVIYSDNTMGVLYNIDLTPAQAEALFA